MTFLHSTMQVSVAVPKDDSDFPVEEEGFTVDEFEYEEDYSEMQACSCTNSKQKGKEGRK